MHSLKPSCVIRLLCIHRSGTLFSHKMCERLFIYIYIILNIYLYHMPPRTAAAMEHHYYIHIRTSILGGKNT